MAFDLSSYEPVAERIDRFWKKYPAGRIHTDIMLINETEVIIKASIYTDREDPKPAAIDYAQETRNSSHINRNSFVENCSTSAIGRALATLNFQAKREGKGFVRPSREEMSKVYAQERNWLEEASTAAANKDLETLRVIYSTAERSQVDNEILEAIKKLGDALKVK